MLGGHCRCGSSCCCQKPVSNKGIPLPKTPGNENTSGPAKALLQHAAAVASTDAAACSSGESRYTSAEFLLPATLQLQHVRLQI